MAALRISKRKVSIFLTNRNPSVKDNMDFIVFYQVYTKQDAS